MNRSSIRSSLLLLVAAMFVPLVGGVVYGIHADMEQSIAHTKASLRTLAKAMVGNTGGKIVQARQTLERIAVRPQVRELDPKRCDGVLAELHTLNPDYANISYTNREGAVICAATLQSGKPLAAVGKETWFLEFLKRQRFSISAPWLSPVTGRRVSVLSVPIWNEQQMMSGGVHLLLDLNAYDPGIPTLYLPEGTRYGFFAEDGIMVWRNLDPENVIGTRPNAEAARRIVALRDGEFEEVAVDSVKRFFSVVPMPEANWVAFVGVPASLVYAGAKQRATTASLVALAAMAVLILLARSISRRISEPIAQLEDATRTVLRGSLATRVATEGPAEVVNMAMAFNAMTERIEASTRQLEAEIIEHRQTETALRESDQRFRDLFERSPDPSWLIHDHQFADCNLAAVSLLGYASRNELLATHPSKLSPEIQPDGQPSFDKAEEMMRTAFERGLHRFEWEHRRADGTCFPVEVTLARVSLQGQEILYCVWRDITERKLLEDQVREMAFHDPLTGLPNRRLLNDRLAQAMEISRRSGCHGAVMLLDLDNFKPLNDHHGHGVGDLLLIEVADRLRACVRKIDTVSRFGGDEFVVLVSELDTDRQQSATQAGAVADKIRQSLGKPYLLALKSDARAAQIVEHRCTASIGITLFYDDTTDQDDILKAADTAMYLAKEAGRNQIRFSAAPS